MNIKVNSVWLEEVSRFYAALIWVLPQISGKKFEGLK